MTKQEFEDWLEQVRHEETLANLRFRTKFREIVRATPGDS